MVLTIVVAVAISLAAIALVVWPLLRPDPPLLLDQDERLRDLIARKDAALLSIRELEFDRQTGKLNDEDFARLNARLRRQALALLERIDRVAPDVSSMDETLEAAIAAQRRTGQVTPNAALSLEDALEAEIAGQRRMGKKEGVLKIED